MTTEEANKIIAEFMGWKKKDMGYATEYCWDAPKGNPLGKSCTLKRYYISLDALVPVWEKLDTIYIEFDKWNQSENEVWFAALNTNYKDEEAGKTIQEAAAIATAKAILDLGE